MSTVAESPLGKLLTNEDNQPGPSTIKKKRKLGRLEELVATDICDELTSEDHEPKRAIRKKLSFLPKIDLEDVQIDTSRTPTPSRKHQARLSFQKKLATLKGKRHAIEGKNLQNLKRKKKVNLFKNKNPKHKVDNSDLAVALPDILEDLVNEAEMAKSSSVLRKRIDSTVVLTEVSVNLVPLEKTNLLNKLQMAQLCGKPDYIILSASNENINNNFENKMVIEEIFSGKENLKTPENQEKCSTAIKLTENRNTSINLYAGIKIVPCSVNIERIGVKQMQVLLAKMKLTEDNDSCSSDNNEDVRFKRSSINITTIEGNESDNVSDKFNCKAVVILRKSSGTPSSITNIRSFENNDEVASKRSDSFVKSTSVQETNDSVNSSTNVKTKQDIVINLQRFEQPLKAHPAITFLKSAENSDESIFNPVISSSPLITESEAIKSQCLSIRKHLTYNFDPNGIESECWTSNAEIENETVCKTDERNSREIQENFEELPQYMPDSFSDNSPKEKSSLTKDLTYEIEANENEINNGGKNDTTFEIEPSKSSITNVQNRSEMKFTNKRSLFNRKSLPNVTNNKSGKTNRMNQQPQHQSSIFLMSRQGIHDIKNKSSTSIIGSPSVKNKSVTQKSDETSNNNANTTYELDSPNLSDVFVNTSFDVKQDKNSHKGKSMPNLNNTKQSHVRRRYSCYEDTPDNKRQKIAPERRRSTLTLEDSVNNIALLKSVNDESDTPQKLQTVQNRLSKSVNPTDLRKQIHTRRQQSRFEESPKANQNSLASIKGLNITPRKRRATLTLDESVSNIALLKSVKDASDTPQKLQRKQNIQSENVKPKELKKQLYPKRRYSCIEASPTKKNCKPLANIESKNITSESESVALLKSGSKTSGTLKDLKKDENTEHENSQGATNCEDHFEESQPNLSNVTLRRRRHSCSSDFSGDLAEMLFENYSSTSLLLEGVLPPWEGSNFMADKTTSQENTPQECSTKLKKHSKSISEDEPQLTDEGNESSLNNTSDEQNDFNLENVTKPRVTFGGLPQVLKTPKSLLKTKKSSSSLNKGKRVTFSNTSVIIIEDSPLTNTSERKSVCQVIPTIFPIDDEGDDDINSDSDSIIELLDDSTSSSPATPKRNNRIRTTIGRTPMHINGIDKSSKLHRKGVLINTKTDRTSSPIPSTSKLKNQSLMNARRTPIPLRLQNMRVSSPIFSPQLSKKFILPSNDKSESPSSLNKKIDSNERRKLEGSLFLSPLVAVAKKVPTKNSKLPNFASLHQKLFNKMEDIGEYSKRRNERADLLLSGKIPVKKNIIKKPQIVCSTPKGVKNEQAGYTRYGFKALPIETVTKQDQIMAIAHKTRPVKLKTTIEKRNEVKGVRSNRRFDLLMQMRNKNQK